MRGLALIVAVKFMRFLDSSWAESHEVLTVVRCCEILVVVVFWRGPDRCEILRGLGRGGGTSARW